MGIILNKETVRALLAVMDAGGVVEINGALSIRSGATDGVNKSHWQGNGSSDGGYERNDRPDPDHFEHGNRPDSPEHDEFMGATESCQGPGTNLTTLPGGRIEVNRSEAREWEIFKFFKAPDGRVAIKSHIGYFSCHDRQIVADAENITETELWRVLGNPDGTVTLVASNGWRLIGNRVTVSLRMPFPFPDTPFDFTFDETAFVLIPKPESGRGCFALMTNRNKFVSVQDP